MLLQLSLLLLAIGLTLLILGLRAWERRRWAATEALVDGFDARLRRLAAARPDLSGWTLRVSGALQSLAFLDLALDASRPEEERAERLQRLEARGEQLLSALAEAHHEARLEALAAALTALREDRAQALARLSIPEELGIENAGEAGDGGEDGGRPEALTGLLELIEAAPPAGWDDAPWGQLEAGCQRLQSLKWAYSAGLLRPETRRLAERASTLLQAAGPAYASLWQAAGPERERLEAALTRGTEALAQVLFGVQTFWRLGQEAPPSPPASGEAAEARPSAEAGEAPAEGGGARRGERPPRAPGASEAASEGALAGELAGAALRSLAEVTRRLEAVEAWGLEAGRCEALVAGMEDWAAGCEVVAAWSLAEAEARVSGRWRVAEMAYGHPRGPAVIAEMGLECWGCPLMEREPLADAALVHGFKLPELLERLEGAR